MPSAGSAATAVVVLAGFAGGAAVLGTSASAAPDAGPSSVTSGHLAHHDDSASPLVTVAARTATVKIVDNRFVPSNLSVRKGTKVKWVWAGRGTHNARAASGPTRFDSGLRSSGSYSRTLSKKGTYTVVCDPHLPHMKMKIKVR
ncbi:cupredoxin domain-containing protein [Patulibacter minatonensis]|uniref:cupredoxin domain-containing protein n=1 Tax=Patulibacter minatonensis TaxID=298163 RepID=UPI00047B9B51|nr:plastocyanin/azurin family copper-binding protein [Patulibacter minatonensis]